MGVARDAGYDTCCSRWTAKLLRGDLTDDRRLMALVGGEEKRKEEEEEGE
jgi:hypothetical protein